MKNVFNKEISSWKAITIIAVLAVLAAGLVMASTTGFNIMSGDQEILRMKNQTQGTVSWQDPISANAGDEIKFLVYYHCGTDDPAWSTIKAYNTIIKLEFPTAQQTIITTTGRVSANNLSMVSDAGTINVSSSQRLDFNSNAVWYHDNVNSTISASLGNGYIQANLGTVDCDYMACYSKTGFVVFTATMSSILPPPTVDLKANNYDGVITIPYNTSATLSWTSTNATSCTASGDWFGTKAISGSESTGSLTSSKNYTITCTGPGGTASDSVGVTVQVSPPTVDLKANGSDGPITIQYNTAATLTWLTTNNPITCTASGSWFGSKSTSSGSESTGNLTATQNNYVLTCSNSAGSANDSVLVQVVYCLASPPTSPF